MSTEGAESDTWIFRRYSRTADVIADWGSRLAQLSGRRLTSIHAQWNQAVPSSGGWWVDGPVLLGFEGMQLEVGALCCEFSVSVDSHRFDLLQVEGDDDESVRVIWRESPWPELERYLGQQLTSLWAVEGKASDDYSGQPGDFQGMSFNFASGSFCFFDAGDELGMCSGPLPDDPNLKWELAHKF